MTTITIKYLWSDPFFGEEVATREFNSRAEVERFFAPMLEYITVLEYRVLTVIERP